MSYKEGAVKKLDSELATFVGDRYQSVMKRAVKEALQEFCVQNEEFAQAVVQGGSFADCMAAVSKNVGTSISDIEAFRRAAAFYFSGAAVKMQMTIQLNPSETPDSQGIVIDLTNFF